MKLLSKLANSSIIDCLTQHPCVHSIRSIIPLFLSIWMNVDLGLDINQTFTYYKHSEDTGSYAKWAKEYATRINSSYIHSVSNIYYYTACVIWIMPPSLLATYFLATYKGPIIVLDLFTEKYLKYEIIFHGGKCYKYFMGILLLPVDILASAIMIYIMVPIASFKNGILLSFQRDQFNAKDYLVFYINSNDLPFWKAFETVGEALPQFILNFIFISSNYEFIVEHETFLGISVPTSVISLVFSGGSLFIGLCDGLPELLREKFLNYIRRNLILICNDTDLFLEKKFVYSKLISQQYTV